MSMDFDWIAEILAEGALAVEPEAVRRAEAAARPEMSRGLHTQNEREPERLFRYRIGLLLDELEARTERRAALDRTGLLDLLNRRLRVERGERKLWSMVMPGVPAALQALSGAGLQLVVVSNADGSIEEALGEAGLDHHFDAIVDSHHVGFEKPDPRIFELALGRAGSSPERTLHVGDLYAADVVGARLADVHALLLDPYEDWPALDCPRMPDLGALVRHWSVAQGD